MDFSVWHHIQTGSGAQLAILYKYLSKRFITGSIDIRDLYRGINDFKKGYQPRTCIVKDEKGDLVADSYSIMTRWRNYFSQLLNVHGAKDVRQAEIHTAEPLVPEPSVFEVDRLLKS